MGFFLFALIDSYQCAKIFNKDKNLEKKVTFVKALFLIIAIIIYGLFVPSGASFSSYVKENIVEFFKLPSASMEPTLQPGDRFIADKAIYKKSKPSRGDLIIYISPTGPRKIFVKRLIAFGGEKLEIKQGHIYVNGEQLTDPRMNSINYYNKGDYGKEGDPVIIPEGYLYVLGDNSASSWDSRFWGYLPEKNVLGKVYKIYWPMERSGPVN